VIYPGDVPGAETGRAVRWREHRARHLAIQVLLLGVIGVVASGCIGAVDRSDFDAEVAARGGGVADVWIDEALTAVAEEVGATSVGALRVLTLTIVPANRTLVAQARRVDNPSFVDTIAVAQGDVVGVTPLQNADDLPLESITVPVSSIAGGRWGELGDAALSEFGHPDSHVTRISMSVFSGEHRIDVAVESPRNTGSVTFDLAGNVIEVDR